MVGLIIMCGAKGQASNSPPQTQDRTDNSLGSSVIGFGNFSRGRQPEASIEFLKAARAMKLPVAAQVAEEIGVHLSVLRQKKKPTTKPGTSHY